MQLLGVGFVFQLQHLQRFLFAVYLVDEGEHERIKIQHVQYHDAVMRQRGRSVDVT